MLSGFYFCAEYTCMKINYDFHDFFNQKKSKWNRQQACYGYAKNQ